MFNKSSARVIAPNVNEMPPTLQSDADDTMEVRSRGSTSNLLQHMEGCDQAETEKKIDFDYEPGDVKDEWRSILLLVLLYVLQGIPLGLAAAVPLMLQNRKVSYKDQALFSFVTWPFSVKLLWAPIVDSIYCNALGRRKSWLVPTQYAIGIFLLVLSSHTKGLLGDESHQDDEPPNVLLLTGVFLMLNFLAATQDIAVDGWALTMLTRKHVGYASTCNSVGQTAGYFLGNVVFLALESADFSNRYLRTVPQKDGLVTLDGFLYFWGVVFIVTTTLIMLLKHERKRLPCDKPDLGPMDTYRMAVRILCLPSVRNFCLFLLTCKIGFAVTDSATGLKLIEAGVHKENLALLAIPIVPLQIVLPFVISKYTTGRAPLNVFLWAYPIRLLFGLIFSALLHWTYLVKNLDGTFPTYFYVVIVIAYSFHQITVYSIYVALMAFHARVSDPTIGGTYMTLLNTVTNFGGNWPATAALWFIDSLTYKRCDGAENGQLLCSSKSDEKLCTGAGGTCSTTIDGYYIETVMCITLGFAWLMYGRRRAQWLQNLPRSAWRCS
ncbi:acetyl-coenzyme A transporter 1-like isoform X2 [Ornithodoros turicata]|uniref:acetyl-coenzyme A transporter 1-like isoform X2 n=1 Tax=Ornithodoros turicata TaxID=34597 RepID=UPI0031399154